MALPFRGNVHKSDFILKSSLNDQGKYSDSCRISFAFP